MSPFGYRVGVGFCIFLTSLNEVKRVYLVILHSGLVAFYRIDGYKRPRIWYVVAIYFIILQEIFAMKNTKSESTIKRRTNLLMSKVTENPASLLSG